MKLREFHFNDIKRPGRLTNLAIRQQNKDGSFGKWFEGCSIGETLNMIPLSFAEAEIKETRWFFDTFVIELEARPNGA